MLRRVHLLVFALVAVFVFGSASVSWAAGPSASGSVSTNKGAKGKSSKFEWPELVVGGNAISALLPLQFGIVGYLPKGRIGFQYDRQIRRAHWVQVGIGVLFDRGNYRNFRMDSCGLEMGGCNAGGVAGVDVYAGYTHKFYLQEMPYIVPLVRGALGYSYFALPDIGGTREQSRIHSSALSLRVGGGVRVFLLSDLALGADVNLPIGLLIHTDQPLGEDRHRETKFLLGIEVLPVVVEYRF